MSIKFLKTAVLKKIKNCPKIFWSVPMLKFLQRLALDVPYICPTDKPSTSIC